VIDSDQKRKSARLEIIVSDLIIYLFPYLVSAAAAAGLGVYVLRKQPRSSLLVWLAVYMFSQTAWTLLYVCELIAPDIPSKLLWDSLQWIPTFSVAYAWVRLVLEYTDVSLKPAWLVSAAFVPLVIFLILVLTDPLHHLVYIQLHIEDGAPFDALIYPFTPLIWTFTLYAYLLYFSGAALVLGKALSEGGYQQARALIVFSGGTLPALMTLIFFAADVRIFGQRDVAPIASMIGSFIILWGLLRYKLFDIVPLARALVFDKLSQDLIVVDLENRVIDANAAALALGGITLSEAVGQLFAKVYPHLARALSAFDQASEFNTDIELMDSGGAPRTFELRAVAIRRPNGKRIGRLLACHDVTDRKHIESALRSAQQRARMLADVAFEGVAIHQNDIMMDCNRAFLDLIGCTFEELKAISLIETVLAPEWRESVRASVAENRSAHLLAEIIRRDGKRLPVEVRSRQIDDELRVTVVRDLSERREAEVQRMNAALERERAAMLAEFVRGVAHEFRTLLANISTSLYLIGKIPDSAQRAERIKQTEGAIRELAALLDQMLLMVKLDHLSQMERRPLRLNALLEAVSLRYQNDIASKRLQFQLEPAIDLPMIMGDEELLIQAFSELLSNAIRFTPNDGQITISIARTDRAAQVSISDSGIGMSSAEQARIFERFYRVDEARTARGFGLGLAIADRIIALHRGSISVDSAPGQGSVFTVLLPIG
jgi:PAS domain S-box-containing protein